MIQAMKKLRIEEMYLSIIMATCNKPIDNLKLNGETGNHSHSI
jgi:hypothetical protein